MVVTILKAYLDSVHWEEYSFDSVFCSYAFIVMSCTHPRMDLIIESISLAVNTMCWYY